MGSVEGDGSRIELGLLLVDDVDDLLMVFVSCSQLVSTSHGLCDMTQEVL